MANLVSVELVLLLEHFQVSMCVSQLDSGVGHSLYSRWLNLMSKLLILIGEKDFVVSSQNDDQEITGNPFLIPIMHFINFSKLKRRK